jgi:hypothetical protein
MATLARVLPSISSTGNKMISSDTAKPGCRPGVAGLLNSSSSCAGASTGIRRDSQLP